MNDPQAKPRSRSSAPTGELPEALRDWADWHYMIAKIGARTCVSAPPGHDPKDWRGQLNLRSLRVINALVSLGIWDPEISDGGE